MKNKYIEDLKEIKEMMHRSSRFISLSGFSGIAAGIIALIGAIIAYPFIYGKPDQDYSQGILLAENIHIILLIAVGTLVIAIGSAIFFTTRKTKKRNEKVWDDQTKRLLINLFIPLVPGGLVCLYFMTHGLVVLVAPMSLIFYGLALVNASKFTLSEVRSLGFIEFTLGLIALPLTKFSLLFWVIGFGLLHIIYGIIIQRKYKS